MSQLFVTETASAVYTIALTNLGNSQLNINDVSVSVADERQVNVMVRNATVSASTVAAGQSALLMLESTAVNAPPDVYVAHVLLRTNAPRCGSVVQSVIAIPWTIQVASVLVFPTNSNVSVVPHAAARSIAFSFLNFVGESVRCRLHEVGDNITSDAANGGSDGSDSSWITLSDRSRSFVAAPGELAVVSVDVKLPSSVTCNNSAACFAIGERVFALQSACYRGDEVQPVSVANLTIVAHPVVGAVSSATSTVAFPAVFDHNSSIPSWALGAAIPFTVVLRDAAYQLVYSADNVLSLLSVTARIVDGGRETSQAADVAFVSSSNSSTGLVALTMSLPRGVFGAVTYSVLIGGSIVAHGGSVTVQYERPVCPVGFVVVTASWQCVCAAGRYFNASSDSCEICSNGTYKYRASNGSVSECVACAAGYFCLAGAVSPTALCPDYGMRCAAGVLSVLPGYWVHNTTAYALVRQGVVNDSTAALSKCPLRDACDVSSGGCAEGYTGPGCAACSPSYAFVRYRCIQCVFAVVGGWLLLVYIALFVVVGGVIVTLSKPEPQVTMNRVAWITPQGAILTALLWVLLDLLQLVAVQSQIPSQLPPSFVVKLLAVTGVSLGPGTWPPTLCLFDSPYTALLFPVMFAVPASAAVWGVSLLLAPVVWKRSVLSKRLLWGRAVLCLRFVCWSLLPGAAWGVISVSTNRAAVIATL